MPLKLHGKEYMTVAERINLLLSQNEVTRHYSLNTDIVSSTYDSDRQEEVIIKATLTLGGQTFTGHAMEEKGNKGVNKTSHVENCETSAIGRALAAAGFHGSEYASADELVEALNKQSSSTPKKADTGNGGSSQPSPESAARGVENSTGGFKGGYYDFLKGCSSAKGSLGEAQYRGVLKEFGVDKANQIDKDNKKAQKDMMLQFSKLKPVYHDMIFPLEVNYICSLSKNAMALMDAEAEVGKDIDSFNTVDKRNDILDKIHIAYQADLAEEKKALSEA